MGDVGAELEVQPQPLGGGGGTDLGHHLVEEGVQVELGPLREGAGLGEVQDVVDEGPQPLPGPAEGGDQLLLLGVGLAGGQQLGGGQDAGERRPDLVAHPGDEVRLGPAGGGRVLLGGLEVTDDPVGLRHVLGDAVHPVGLPVDEPRDAGDLHVEDPAVGVPHRHLHLLHLLEHRPGEGLGRAGGVAGLEQVGERGVEQVVHGGPADACAGGVDLDETTLEVEQEHRVRVVLEQGAVRLLGVVAPAIGHEPR